jgi:sugar phosphate isomerase/epimerase
MFSFSTCWNSHRHTNGRAMLREIRDLGFEYAELSHGTRITLMPGILEAVDAGEIRISSLHNFCPLPMGVNHAAPNLYQYSDERHRERELAHKHTLRTLDFAVRVKAPLVVLHVGSIEMKGYTDKLLEMLERGEKDSAKYKKLCEEFIAKRDKSKKDFWSRTIASLKKLVPEAESRGVKLGVENRQSLEELPIESDYDFLFHDISSSSLVYWHDTGHAQIKENLGFLNHRSHLESQRARLAGFHIHDVQFPGKDHSAPGTGSIDFAGLKSSVKPDHIKVFEFSPSLSPEEAKRGAEHIQKLWDDK